MVATSYLLKTLYCLYKDFSSNIMLILFILINIKKENKHNIHFPVLMEANIRIWSEDYGITDSYIDLDTGRELI